MSKNPVDEYTLTDYDLAERWGMSLAAVRAKRYRKQLPACLKVSGRPRYRLQDIQAHEQAGIKR